MFFKKSFLETQKVFCPSFSVFYVLLKTTFTLSFAPNSFFYNFSPSLFLLS